MDIGAIFDWDGVIIDSSAAHERSWDILAAEEKLPLFPGHFKMGFGRKNQFIIPQILKWSQDPQEIARLPPAIAAAQQRAEVGQCPCALHRGSGLGQGVRRLPQQRLPGIAAPGHAGCS